MLGGGGQGLCVCVTDLPVPDPTGLDGCLASLWPNFFNHQPRRPGEIWTGGGEGDSPFEKWARPETKSRYYALGERGGGPQV